MPAVSAVYLPGITKAEPANYPPSNEPFIRYEYTRSFYFNRLNVSGNLGGIDCIYLFDTGADVSLVSITIAAQLPNTAQIYPLARSIYCVP